MGGAPAIGLGRRVYRLLQVSDDVAAMFEAFDAREQIRDGPNLTAEGLTCVAPNGKRIFDNMTFGIKTGESLLVMGPSGAGKSSLLRAIGGIWPFDSGVVTRPLTIGRSGS